MQELGKRIAALAPAKRALLEQRLVAKREPRLAGNLTRRSGNGPAPLSFSQERLWFLALLEPESIAYNMGRAYRLKGILNVPSLEQALGEIQRRHEVLRTIIAYQGNEVVQVVVPERRFNLAAVELPLEKASRMAGEEICHPFDLGNGPSMRVALFRLAADDHVLTLTFHHIAFDGWSGAVFNRELSLLYEAFCGGRRRSLVLPDLPVQYSDYAVWQRKQLADDRIEAHLSYWRQRLANAPLLELPTDHPRPALQSYSGDRLPFSLSSDLSAKLRSFNRGASATAFMTLLTAYQVLLSRYSGQLDILVGSPIANRQFAELENMVGFFVNTLVLRADLSARPSFRELVARNRQTVFDAYQYQDLPFERLVQELNPPRDTSRHPIFQVSFALQNFPFHRFELSGLEVSEQPVRFTSTRFDLELNLWPDEDLWRGFFSYSTALFDAGTIERLASHYQVLLEALLTEPDRPVADVALLAKAEREQLLSEWNDSAAEYPREKCFDELFEAQTRRTPDAVAAVSGGQQLTYYELSERSNKVARRLQEWGVHQEVLVGICMERSIDMIVGLLGILKAGGAYVPLDPTYPKERLDHILDDAKPRLVLTESALAGKLFREQPNVLCIEKIGDELARAEAQPASHARSSSNLAYVLYTSGSTGQPKGVEVTHRSLVNFLTSMAHVPGMNGHDTLLAVTTLAFDIAGLELFLPLMVGARVVIADSEEVRDGTKLLALIESCGATVMQATPATWRMLLAAGWQGHARLKILCGGEAWPRELAEDLLKRCGSLWNMYGPTETTIWSAVAKVKDGQPVVVGPPIANTSFYILDENRQPVPIGVPGELYIGGDGVARGYFKRPELTAEKFIVNPFSLPKEVRLYRTGDLARYRLDGTIEFLGRKDSQVKIRGFRIELGEIEAILGKIEGIRQTIVAVSEDGPETKRLIAYLVPQDIQAAPSLEALRGRLKQALPDYMVPSAFVVLDKLPLTPSGKVDRRALPPPQRIDQASDRAELTQTEQIVSGVWSEGLNTENLGMHESFFDLGGHSLLAIKIIFALRRILHVDVAVAALFANPTVSSLSRHIDELVAADHQIARPTIETVPRTQPLPLSLAQERLWREERKTPNSDNIYVLLLDLEGRLNISCLERSFEELGRRHEIFRTTFHLAGDSPVQRISADQLLKVNVVDLTPSGDPESEVAQLVVKEKTDPISLSCGPLLRLSVLRIAPNRHRLLLKLHHMLYDTWSLSMFLREFDILYRAFCSGKESPLPDLTVQIADFAVWQRRYLDPSSNSFQAQLGYWRKKLSSHSPVLRLPCERPSELKAASLQEVLCDLEIPHELSTSLRALTRREGTTSFMTFLAALKALINLSTGQNDIMVGAYMAKRSVPETDRMMGFFSDLVPLRTSVSCHLSFCELLNRVRETVLDAQAHEEMPFDMLGGELKKCGQVSPDLRAIFMVDTLAERYFGELQVRQLPVAARNTMPWGFQMRVRDEKKAFSVRAKFDARLHDPRRVRRMISRYVKLLHAIARSPTARLCDLEEALDQHYP